MANRYVGKSGWNYRGWRGSFFPDGLPTRAWLSYYASRLNSVEVNYSFYRLPSDDTYLSWYRDTPNDFLFVLKASRFITHIKRLRGVRDAWNSFMDRASILSQKLGPILLQFPPSFRASRPNLDAIAEFLRYAGGKRVALEFRHESCFGAEMTSMLRAHNAALVIAQSSRFPVPAAQATADFVYFRFHGPREWCASPYSELELREWASYMNRFAASGKDVFAYFNNDSGAHAPPNALTLARAVNAMSEGRDAEQHFPDSHQLA
jgi:uncharacterized protein YecE (DUF72 family)